MEIGVLVNNFGGFPETGRSARACIDLALHAERLGFDSVWVTDHVVLPRELRAGYPHGPSGFPYTWEQDIFEPVTLMAALAQATERVKIGVSVLVIPYRHPLLAAKMLATVDCIADGRVVLGAGVGWLQDEFEALGLPEEHFAHRGGVTVDYLRAMQRAWTARETASHQGPYARFSDVGARPRPPRADGIPVWIGGDGERALRRAVDLGAGYLAIGASPERLADETRRLRELAVEAGRDPAALTVAHIDGIVLGDAAPALSGASLQGSAERVLDGLRSWADAGLQHLVAGIGLAGEPGFEASVAALEQVAAEILPEARALPAGSR